MLKQLIEKSYYIETEEINEDKMEFVIINRKPADVNVKNVEEELFRIFKKYA